jgi:hypothetical protein
MEIIQTHRCGDIVSALHNLVIEGRKPDCSAFKSANASKDRFNVVIYEQRLLLASFTLHMDYDNAKEAYEGVVEELEHLKGLYVQDLAE